MLTHLPIGRHPTENAQKGGWDGGPCDKMFSQQGGNDTYLSVFVLLLEGRMDEYGYPWFQGEE